MLDAVSVRLGVVSLNGVFELAEHVDYAGFTGLLA